MHKGGPVSFAQINDALDYLTGVKYFSMHDLASGYWQLKVDKEDIQKTAFSCHRGLFELVRTPFGFCNAPATMQYFAQSLVNIKWERVSSTLMTLSPMVHSSTLYWYD